MTDTLKQKEALDKIAEILHDIDTKFAEAVEIAEEAGVEFRFGGPDRTYGMGGTYVSKAVRMADKDDDEEWTASDDEYSGWQSSSNYC